jgi:hypothetical protein
MSAINNLHCDAFLQFRQKQHGDVRTRFIDIKRYNKKAGHPYLSALQIIRQATHGFLSN